MEKSEVTAARARFDLLESKTRSSFFSWSHFLQKTGIHPRVKPEGRLFPENALVQKRMRGSYRSISRLLTSSSHPLGQSMIPKSGYRLSEKIMLKQRTRDGRPLRSGARA